MVELHPADVSTPAQAQQSLDSFCDMIADALPRADKTVKRAVQCWRAGTVAQPRTTPPGGRNADCVEDLIFDKVRKTRCRITAKRLLPQARAAGYTGSPDDENASSTETFNLFLRR